MMKHHTSKLGILIIVIILGIVGVLIVTKTRSERFADTSTVVPVSSPDEIISSDEYIASSSDLSSPIPVPPIITVYAYPKALDFEVKPNSLRFNTTDSAQEVTDWYKNKINSLGFNAKSFTQTSTDGVTLNKITAAKPGENIEVTIKKDQTTSNVQITVDRS